MDVDFIGSRSLYNAVMNSVTVQDLQRDPLGLLSRVEAGEQVVVVRDGNPIAEIRPVVPPILSPRPHGLAAGAFTVPDDFDAPLPEDTLRDFIPAYPVPLLPTP